MDFVDLIFICIASFLFFDFIRQEKPKEIIRDDKDIKLDIYKLKQEYEDKQVERDAKLEANDMFMQYLAYKNSQINRKIKGMFGSDFVGLLIPKPRRFMIVKYPGQTSKFENTGDYDKIRKKEFEKLKNSYENDIKY